MKRMTFVICAIILGISIASEMPVLAGLRIVPDPAFSDESGRKGGQIRISDLVHRIVKNPQGQDLGLVSDVLVDRKGRIAFIVISGGDSHGEQLIPIPFKSVLFGGYENWLVLKNVNRAAFENAPSIGKDQWYRLEDPAFENEVFSYYGRQQGRT